MLELFPKKSVKIKLNKGKSIEKYLNCDSLYFSMPFFEYFI
jgi:hypothetical protein